MSRPFQFVASLFLTPQALNIESFLDLRLDSLRPELEGEVAGAEDNIGFQCFGGIATASVRGL